MGIAKLCCWEREMVVVLSLDHILSQSTRANDGTDSHTRPSSTDTSAMAADTSACVCGDRGCVSCHLYVSHTARRNTHTTIAHSMDSLAAKAMVKVTSV